MRSRTELVTLAIEVDVEVEVELEPGERAVMWGDNAHPGCAPSGAILSVKLVDGSLELTDAEQDAAVEAALDQAFEVDAGAAEDAAQARYDARYDD